MQTDEIVQRVVRSLIASTPEEVEVVLGNFNNTDFRVVSFSGVASKVVDWVKACFTQFGGPPDFESLKLQAIEAAEPEAQMYLGTLETVELAWGVNYSRFLESWCDEVGKEKLNQILTTTHQVLHEGIQTTEGVQKGLREAMLYAVSSISALQQIRSPHNRPMDNEVAVEYLKQEYTERSLNPSLSYGLGMGFKAIDDSTKGAQPGELWLLVGAPGHGKSTLGLNWCRYLAVNGDFNILIYSLEMAAEQVWRILACGHCAHPKFNHEPLSYTDIKAGTLNPDDHAFYYDQVLPDLMNSGRIVVYKPDSLVSMSDIRAVAEAENSTRPLDMVFIDYLGLVSGDKNSKARSRYDVINENIASAKRMALDFDKGNSIVVASPHQVNRAGQKAAEEANGVYRMDALADTAEAERWSDVILAIYQDLAWQQRKEAVITNLKTRDGRKVEPFHVCYPPEFRYVEDLAGNVLGPDILDA